MNLIRLNPTRWPYSLQQLREDEPGRSFSASPRAIELAYFQVFVVQPTAQPAFDPDMQKVVEVMPLLVAGQWQQQWEVVALTEEEQVERYRATHPPRWIEFWAALPPEVDTLLTAAQAASPRLALSLGVGLGKAADGDSRVFIGAWQSAQLLGLVSAELIAGVQQLAIAHDLPTEFVEGLA
jgi:hypothetical protein